MLKADYVKHKNESENLRNMVDYLTGKDVEIGSAINVRDFEKENAVSETQRGFLTFGGVLFAQNWYTAKTLKTNRFTVEKQKSGLENWWLIYNREDAIETLNDLINLDVHTPIINEIYLNFIAKGITEPVTSISEETVQAIPALVERANKSVDEMIEGLKEFKESNPEEYENLLEERFLSILFNRINGGLQAYSEVLPTLEKIGFDMKNMSLKSLKSIGAWDLGRACYIARQSFAIGYISEEEAWEYLEKVADRARLLYDNWEEYMLAYILGRAIGWMNNSHDEIDTFCYLLGDDNSPFNTVDFKTGADLRMQYFVNSHEK